MKAKDLGILSVKIVVLAVLLMVVNGAWTTLSAGGRIGRFTADL